MTKVAQKGGQVDGGLTIANKGIPYTAHILIWLENYCLLFFCCSNLMGSYLANPSSKGVNWQTWRGYDYSLKGAIMMIRPKKI